MSQKRIIILVGSFLLCLSINILSHNSVLISFSNSFSLILSIFLFEQYSRQKISINPIFIIFFGFIPLFHFKPQSPELSLGLLLISILWLLGIKFSKLKIIFYSLILFLFIYGTLVNGSIAYLNGTFDHERLLFSDQISKNIVVNRQEDALFLPYRLRPIVYNSSIFIYSALEKIFQLISLKTIYDILLLANIYPLIIGIVTELKIKKQNWFLYLNLIITLGLIGINRSPDKFNSFYYAAPMFLYLILAGFKKINLKIYSFLLLLSLYIVYSP